MPPSDTLRDDDGRRMIEVAQRQLSVRTLRRHLVLLVLTFLIVGLPHAYAATAHLVAWVAGA